MTTEPLAEAFMLWKDTEKRFLLMVIQRLIEDVPEFNAGALLTQMELLQENWPVSCDDADVASKARVSLRFWGELTEVVEGAVDRAADLAN